MNNPQRTFDELRSTGLLWLINRVVLHPRGYALALHFTNDDPNDLGEATGWSILGDGTEVWKFANADDYEDQVFAKIKELLP